MENSMNELRAIVMRAGDKWTATGLPRVAMVRAEACSDQVYEPMLHLVLQGTKSLSIGDQILRFVPATYFVVPVDLPALGQVCGAPPRRNLPRAEPDTGPRRHRGDAGRPVRDG
jgi:hypothetical protein